MLLKLKLSPGHVLGYADLTRTFIVETDAGGQGLGAVLCQQQGDRKRVIAYSSRRLSNAEKNDWNYSCFRDISRGSFGL